MEGKTREEIKTEFDKYVESGQIAFTTFHQSMSYEDLRQMYAYSRFHNNATTALVYPADKNDIKSGVFKDDFVEKCGILKLAVADDKDIKKWQSAIANYIGENLIVQ
jgi:hypothetical protein